MQEIEQQVRRLEGAEAEADERGALAGSSSRGTSGTEFQDKRHA